MALQGKLYHSQRYITTHDPKTGKAIFDNSIPPAAPFYQLPTEDDGKENAMFATMFTTEGFPTRLYGDKDEDLQTYDKYLKNPPGVIIGNGTVLRYVDMPPGALSPMHRTISLDYGVVIEGEIALVLDSGEERVMKRGDVSIQRATNHAWRNMSKTNWARMLYILQPVQPVEVAGQKLGEEYGGMKGVRAST